MAGANSTHADLFSGLRSGIVRLLQARPLLFQAKRMRGYVCVYIEQHRDPRCHFVPFFYWQLQ